MIIGNRNHIIPSVSVDVLAEKYPSFINYALLLNGVSIISLDLHTSTEKNDKTYFCSRWPTQKTTPEGLNAIRALDSCFRTKFVEPRQRVTGQRRGRILQNPIGEVNFYLNGHMEPTPLDLNTFLNENSLRYRGDNPHPLCWIRVDTEYADYWFDGEYSQTDDQIVKKDRRIAGLTSLYNISDQLLEFYQMTNLIFHETHAHEIHYAINALLEQLPPLQQRIIQTS